MASVFLSYDRDDGKQARPIATAIEKAGHSVWWIIGKRAAYGPTSASPIPTSLTIAKRSQRSWRVELPLIGCPPSVL
jgi:hypothetical protein